MLLATLQYAKSWSQRSLRMRVEPAYPELVPQNFRSVFPIFELLQNASKVCTPALLSDALQDKQPIP